MPCKSCPAKKASCWLSESLASSDAERFFKVQANNHLDITSTVCLNTNPQQPKSPIFWLLTIDKHIAKVLWKNSYLHEIASLIPRELDLNGQGRQNEIAFVKDVLSWLEEASEKGLFDRLVICAPPHMLGEIRPLLAENLAKCVIAEIDKDLTKLSEPKLKEALSEIFWFS